MTDPARRLAVDVVAAVEGSGAYANLLLPRLLRERRLATRDAAFATELAYGTLRWQGCLDAVIAVAARRPVADLDPPVRAVLRVGAYQLLHLRTPAHAAVHATVEVARAAAGHRPVGLVNAVLRAVGRQDWAAWVRQLAPADDRLGAMAFAAGYPRWVAAAFLDALDGDSAELEDALAADRPVTHLVARPGRLGREALLAAAGPGAVAGPWSPYAVRLAAGDPAGLAEVRDGRAGVQDEGSQLAALVLAAAPVDNDRGQWLDLCAGPGGKAALLAGLLPSGGRLLAADRREHRARLAAAALGGARGTAAVVADGAMPSWPLARFDRVLVDAPCSGLGALRRRPEVRWRRQPDDVAALHPLQVSLLTSALHALRPGGVVGYVTCSPHRHETSDVVAAVRARSPVPAEPVDVRPLLPGVPGLGAGPDVQLWPHRHGTDAMYVAVLRRGVADR